MSVAIQRGIVATAPADSLGYFGWPSVCRLADGRIAVVASGLRSDHVCPFGRTVLTFSADDGDSWTSPRVIGDTPLDDRDAGIVELSDGTLVVSWFTMHHGQRLRQALADSGDRQRTAAYTAAIAAYTDALLDRWYGSWTRASEDGGQTWSGPRRAPITAPHGPIVAPTAHSPNRLLYLGKEFLRGIDGDAEGSGPIAAYSSEDAGRSWTHLGSVPTCPGTQPEENQEPHVVARGNGVLLGLVRLSALTQERLDAEQFINYSMAETYSNDGGSTWSMPSAFPHHGSTPHLMGHSSGRLLATFGCREQPYGVGVKSASDSSDDPPAARLRWTLPRTLTDDGIDRDVGYPASVELENGDVLTVSYGRIAPGDEKCSLLWARWQLNE